MIRRRRSIAITVVAALGAVATAMAAAPAQASSTICVALVVDFGDLGGGVHSSCATVRSGATGYDVLSAGGHEFSICSNGVLGSIDGKPSDGCTEKNDSVHYWSYWHRAPGSSTWTYSNEGGGSYQPKANSTEGWHWMKAPPANVPYAQICHPSPSPTPMTSRTTHAPTPAPQTSQPAAQPAATSTPTGQPVARHRHGRNTAKVEALRTTTPVATPSATSATTTSALTSAQSDHRSGSHRSTFVLVAAVAAAVLLGAVAWWRNRNSGGAS